ncbi:MAG: MBL fold metallo-hydrolase [Proteobacteria bacterium]|nr:MBL fold metallo-hydrolase [Pseudomonadota bacterium]
MRFRIRTFLVLTLVLAIALSASTALGAEKLSFITDGVYGYVNDAPGTPGNLYAANVGVIVGDDAVLVVDTLTSADEAKMLISDIKKITDKPIRYVFNTHYHLDHALGNAPFAALGAITISQSACRDMLIKNGETVIHSAKAWGLPEDFWNTTRIAPASITFEREMRLDLGNLPVRLVFTGFASHSPGSSIAILPTKQTVFTGDILFTGIHPYLGDADIAGWQRNLDSVTALDMKYIVPGHGPLSSNTDLADLKSYLQIFDALARELSATMNDPEAITAEMLKRLPAKQWGDALVGMNIRMRYMGKHAGYSN